MTGISHWLKAHGSKFFWTGLCVLLSLVTLTHSVQAAEDCNAISCNKGAQSEDEYLSCNKRKQSCLETNIQETRNAAITLSSTISILNGQISVQELQIAQTETEIEQLERQVRELGDRITGLNMSLDRLGIVLVDRVNEDYKNSRTNTHLLLLASQRLNTFLSNYKYLELARHQTTVAMQQAETQKADYDVQKALKESKQQEVEKKHQLLEVQKRDLAARRQSQQQLLTDTKNNEANFQRELDHIREEMAALQAILAGKGDESYIKDVKQGDVIASVIQGESCNSSGTHLHFTVVKGGVVQNPFNYLKSIEFDSFTNDPFNPTGDWDWPISPKIRYSQGYGETWAVRNTWVGSIYRFHNGIDINGGSADIRAVKDGRLLRGSYSGSRGCRLRYVKVEHKDSDISTYYLHVNY